MRKKSGFTLVELVVTTGIIVLLVLVSIPRYNALVNKNGFSSTVQNLTHCVRIAQEAAATPSTDAASQNTGYVVLTVRNTPGATDSMDCYVKRYQRASTKGGELVLTNSLVAGNGFQEVESGYFFQRSYSNLQMLDVAAGNELLSANNQPALPLILIFGVQEHGTPLVLCRLNCHQAVTGHQNPYPGNYANSRGLGFATSILIQDSTTSSVATPTRGILRIDPLGAPVTFTLSQ